MDQAYFVACQSKAELSADAATDRCDDEALAGGQVRAAEGDEVRLPQAVPGDNPSGSACPVVSVPLEAFQRVSRIAGDQFQPGSCWSAKDGEALTELRGKATESGRLVDRSPHFRARPKIGTPASVRCALT
jgi:hypothetical protein